jgi:hypothetical protein
MKTKTEEWNCKKIVAFMGMWLLIVMWSSMALAAPGPIVNAMPSGDTVQSAYTWVGNSIDVWGNVKWGTSPSGTYVWNFGDGTPPTASAAVGNSKYISVNHTYAAGGLYDATLTVIDSNGLSDSATVRIYVKTAVDKDARIELAIEKGLKWLYLSQRADGSIWSNNYYGSTGTETAAAVNAFENRNHKPCTRDLNSDGVVDAADRAIWEKDRIYAETVHKGLDYVISTLTTVNLGSGSAFDSNGNGVAVADNYGPTGSNRGTYKIGMYMMALVAAGDKVSGAPELVATTGPAGITGKTYRKLVEDMVDYCDYAQYKNATYGGGWIYGPGEGYGDNSASQWPAIGMEAAQTAWGVPVRQAIKDFNFAWINYSQYYTGLSGSEWYYGALGYTGPGYGTARTASGICQLSFQGKLKNDPRILAAAKFLGSYESNLNNWEYGRTSYNMYAISKAARIAKIDTNGDGIGDTYSEIQLLNGWDWYDAVSTELLNQQNADGHWNNWGYSVATFDTAWAVEVLTRNVFTLRPVAVMTASPNPTPALSPVQFDISGSNHQDPTKSLSKWWIDVNGDGVYDLDGSFPVSGPISYAGYPEKSPPANYTVNAKLRVSDNSSPQEFAETTIPVTISTSKVPPVANAGGPYNGTINTPITFNGSASYSPNPGGTIVKYEWDLDGNNTFETNSGSSPTVQKTWNAPYSGFIGLKVTDNDGLTATTSTPTQVFVVDLWPEHYVKVSEKRISTYVYEYTYKFDMRNRGNAPADNVKTTLDSWPATITVVDGSASFGSIAGPSVKTSIDTFSFRADRRIAVTDAQLKWKLEYDDIGGSHVTFINFPLR